MRRLALIGLVAALPLGLLARGAPARAADVSFRGTLEVAAAERGRAYVHNVLTRGDSPFDAYGLRLYATGQVNDRLAVFSQFVLRDATTPYVDGAYLMFTPFAARDLHVLAGKIPWCIGTWAPRTYPEKNPLTGSPLMYQYHTSLVWYSPPPNVDALVAAAGSGQYGVSYWGYAMGRGTPLVDDSYWDVGVTVTGSQRPFEYALGVNAGTPGWGSTSQDENAGKSVLGRLGCSPAPWIRFGASGAYGPYLPHSVGPRLPAGHEVTDYHQKLAMADLELLAGHAELRAEAARNFWETPTVGELGARSFYAELKYALPVGAFLAGRWDVLRFDEVTTSSGDPFPWDWDVDRYEVGAGYRFTRETTGKLVYQHTRLDAARANAYPTFSMVAAQVVVGF